MIFVDEIALHHKVLENMYDAVLILDTDYNILDCNHVANIWYGYSKEEIKNLSLLDIRAPGERNSIDAQMKLVYSQNGGLWETVHMRKDGTSFPVEISSIPIIVGNKKCFYHVIRDISKPKIEERYRKVLDMQRSVSHCLVDTESLVDATRNAIDTMCNTWGFSYGKIWAWDKKDNALRYVSSWSNGKYIDKITEQVYSLVIINNNDILPSKVMSTGEPAWVEDLTAEPGIYYPVGFKYITAIAVPIINEKDIIGVIELVSDSKIIKAPIILEALIGACEQIGSFLKRKKFEKELFYLSKHDPITGLSNRAFFEEILAIDINLAKSNGQKLAVFFLDIDSFHIINEGMGHSAGDQLLRLIAVRLVEIGISKEKLGRFGPQFAIIFSDIDKDDALNLYIKNIISATFDEYFIQGQNIKIQFNIGVCVYPDDGNDINTLIRSASVALNSAKEVGGGAIQFCTKDLNNKAMARMKIENDLHSALENDEFVLYYQPIIDIPAFKTVGFESLIRWNKNGNIINPTEFIQIAEKNHLIISIGEWIIRTACAQCKNWQKNNAPVSISVNISPVQFNHSGVIDVLRSVLEYTGLDSECLKVEITESAVMDNSQKSINVLKKIKDMGIKISIDDFGTGYSSLNYLRHLPIDFLKIDQSFVRNMTNDANDAAIVKTIIDLSVNLGYKVIAEGVETKEQLNLLSILGCHFIQGYYFSKPMLPHDATDFLNLAKLTK